MKIFKASLLMAFASTAAWAQPDMQTHEVQMDCKNASQKINGKINGNRIVDYVFKVCGKQKTQVSLKSISKSINFNVMKGDSMKAIFNGAVEGSQYESTLEKGSYKIRLYMTKNARGSGEVEYALDLSLKGKGKGKGKHKGKDKKGGNSQAKADFMDTVESMGITFKVSQTGNQLTITPSGLEKVNAPMIRKVEGKVSKIKTTDLNGDDSPEIFVVMKSDKGETLVAYSANKKKSLSEVYVTPVANMPELKDKYVAHDKYIFNANSIERTFPEFSMGMSTNQTARITYELVSGEAGWVLKAQ